MYKVEIAEIEALQQAMKNYKGNTENAINEVLHNQAGEVIQEQIKLLMPASNRTWRGKKPPAKTSNSLKNVNENLAVTVTTTSNYHYLYFADDGTNTRKHIGNQQFFASGGEKSESKIVDLCIGRLIEEFE